MTYDINGVESLINSIPLHDKQSEDVCCVYATSTQFAVVIAYFSSQRSYQVAEQTVYRKINCVFTASHFTFASFARGTGHAMSCCDRFRVSQLLDNNSCSKHSQRVINTQLDFGFQLISGFENVRNFAGT